MFDDSKLSHYRLGRITETSINEIYVFDAETLLFIFVNQGARENLGYSEDELSKMTSVDIKPNMTIEGFRNLTRPLKEGAKRSIVFENTHLRKDGTEYPVEVHLQLFKDQDPHVFVAIILDITERNRTIIELEHARGLAEDSSRAKSEFLASMSHELRTPMNAVIGFAELLKLTSAKNLDQKQEGYIDNILEGGTHLFGLINEILDLSKIEANKVDLEMEDVAICQIVYDCYQSTRHLGSKQGVHCYFSECDARCGKVVRIDRTRFRQVLYNLLSNAVKFNKLGGSVFIVCEPTGNDYVRVSVTDTGIGFSEENHGNIFEMFHHGGGDPTIAKSIQGTGIGLAVTRQLVEKMNGRIGFESKIGEGSTFWVELPCSNQNALPDLVAE